jgi:hypothetical protein
MFSFVAIGKAISNEIGDTPLFPFWETGSGKGNGGLNRATPQSINPHKWLPVN